MIFKNFFNHFSLIIFYHSVWLGFELFWLRVQVSSLLVQITLVRKGYDNHHCHNKPQTGNGLEYGWRHAQKRWAENLEDYEKKIQLRIDHGVKKLGSDHGVEKLKSDHGVENLRLDHPRRQLSFCHWGIENGVLCHWVEFSTVAAVVNFCGSRPAKMNWDLKHHEMCQTLGVVLV